MTPAEVLRGARALIGTDQSWIQTVWMAMRPTETGTGECFCIIGAVVQVTRPGALVSAYPIDLAASEPLASRSIQHIREAIFSSMSTGEFDAVVDNPNRPFDAVTDWNDEEDRTHAQVLEALDTAIALAEHAEASAQWAEDIRDATAALGDDGEVSA